MAYFKELLALLLLVGAVAALRQPQPSSQKSSDGLEQQGVPVGPVRRRQVKEPEGPVWPDGQEGEEGTTEQSAYDNGETEMAIRLERSSVNQNARAARSAGPPGPAMSAYLAGPPGPALAPDRPPLEGK